MPLTASNASSLRSAAKKLAGEINEKKFEFAKILWNTKNNTVNKGGEEMPVYQAWGHTSWKEYLIKELDVSPSRAVEYVHVWEVFGIKLKGKWDKSQITTLGKMVILADYATPQNVTALLKRASGLNEDELRQAIDPTRKGPAAELLTSITLRIGVSNAREVRSWVMDAKERLKVRNQTEALFELIKLGHEHRSELKARRR